MNVWGKQKSKEMKRSKREVKTEDEVETEVDYIPEALQKQRKIGERKEKKKKEREYKGGEDSGSSKEFIFRCRPSKLSELIQHLNDVQRSAVESIGFGGLLTLHDWKSTQWKEIVSFLKKFNHRSRVLEFEGGKEIVVTPDDIADLFLLPRNEGNDVLMWDENDEGAVDFLEDFKNKYGLKDGFTQSVVSNLFYDEHETRLKDGGDDFKRLFILLALSSFLTPTLNFSVDLSTFRSLIDIEKVSSFDWCKFVLDRLCEALAVLEKNPSRKYVNGCLIILPLLYFHRVMWLGVPEKSTLPLIQHWTSSKFNKRLKDESLAGSLFGQGEWIEGVYPVSSSKAKKIDVIDLDEETDEDFQDIPNEDGRYITYKLPLDEKDDAEIKAIAKNPLDECFLLLKRDINMITHIHMDRLKKIKQDAKQQETATTSSSPNDVSEFVPNSRVHDCIDEVVKKLEEMKKDYPIAGVCKEVMKEKEMDKGCCHEMNTDEEINIPLDAILSIKIRRKTVAKKG